MQLCRYLVNYFHCPAGVSVVKFAAGQFYAQDEETARHVEQGYAELIDAPADVEAAAQAADKATAVAEKAVAKAVEANDAADAAAAAAAVPAVAPAA